ncbi:MAG TPA: PIN domain-containing protein, partial [Desulfuromonadaceae bacterium]
MKNFVLDTNVLLHDPQALFKFQENNIIIPITVIEEIDRFKKDMNETGRNARMVSRILDTMREKGSLAVGVSLPDQGSLRVEMFSEKHFKNLPVDMRVDSGDNRILGVALDMRDRYPDTPLVFVTKDTNLRIKADAIGLIVEDYESDKIDIQDLYSGTRTIAMASEEVDRFYGQGWLNAPEDLDPNKFIT